MTNPIRHTYLSKRYAILIASSLILLTACDKKAAPEENMDKTHGFKTVQMLADFDQGTIPEVVRLDEAEGRFLANGPGQALLLGLNTSSAPYSGLELAPATPWDFSGYENISIAFDAQSLGDHTTQLVIVVKDRKGQAHTRSAVIRSNGMQSYYSVLSGDELKSQTDGEDEFVELNLASGMRSNPPPFVSDYVQLSWLWGTKNLDLSGIASIKLSSMSSTHDKEILIDNIRIVANPPIDETYLTGIMDAFGQAAKKDFSNKVHSIEDLKAARDKELASFVETPFEGRSRFGGWANGPKLEATGYFRTEKYQGKWSLVDPDGYLYLATGVAVIRRGDTATMTGLDYETFPEDEDHSKATNHIVASPVRRNLFKWLPGEGDPLSKHYGYAHNVHSGLLDRGLYYDFYGANLERKYGPDYMDHWREKTVSRMLNWGFTSLGNWTDPSLYNNERIPYFANAWIRGDFKTVSSGDDFWTPLADVFDPAWEAAADAAVQKVTRETQGSPWCVGVFIDNEISFGRPSSDETIYGIPIHTLRRDGAEVPTKAAFTKIIREKYESIEALNEAWESTIASWSEFDKGIDSTLRTPAQVADYAMLLQAYGEKYYGTIAKSLEQRMPNHLYLGSRMPDWGMPMPMVRAAKNNLDVLSFNLYKENLFDDTWAFLEEMDMPSIIGEYSIGSTDSGHYHFGIIDSENQQDRAKKFTDYLESLMSNPYFVGAHWFQYLDSAMTGRVYDGENYNNGFVRVTDIPYQPMVDASKSFHQGLYERRFGNK